MFHVSVLCLCIAMSSVKNEAWLLHKPQQPTTAWQDEHQCTLELAAESQALLNAISAILAKHQEQMQIALHANEIQIIQAVQDTRRLSLSKVEHLPTGQSMSAWHEMSTVPFPSSATEEYVASAPVEEAPELTPMEHLMPQATTLSTDTSYNPAVADMIPEYMKETARTEVMRKLKEHASSNSLRLSRKSTLRELRELDWQGHVHSVLNSKVMEFIVTTVIMLNAVNIGVQADWSMKNSSRDTPWQFQVANSTFSVLFLIELLLRLFAFRKKFFLRSNRDFSWNLFDLVLVLSGVADEAINLLISTPSFTVIRAIRVVRLVRVIRVVRVLRFFKELRIIVIGIAGAMHSMIWAIALLFMMMFIVSICLMELTAFQLRDLDTDVREALMAYYGSLILSIYTLYQSTTGGIDWGESAQPLLDINPALAVLYALYIAFSVLCVLNVITGLFVENASSASAADEEQIVIEEFEARVRWFEEVKKLFTSMVGVDGHIDYRSFQRLVENVKIQACLRKLGVDVYQTSTKSLFQILDFDGTGMVDLEEFAMGLQMLHGDAKKIDLARIQREISKIRKTLKSLSRDMRAPDSSMMSHSLSPAALHASGHARGRESGLSEEVRSDKIHCW